MARIRSYLHYAAEQDGVNLGCVKPLYFREYIKRKTCLHLCLGIWFRQYFNE